VDISQVASYAAVAAITVAISLGMLCITKIPTVIIICSALLAALLHAAYFRVTTGQWGMFIAIEFIFVAAFSCAVSFVLLGIGRYLKWPFFFDRSHA